MVIYCNSTTALFNKRNAEKKTKQKSIINAQIITDEIRYRDSISYYRVLFL